MKKTQFSSTNLVTVISLSEPCKNSDPLELSKFKTPEKVSSAVNRLAEYLLTGLIPAKSDKVKTVPESFISAYYWRNRKKNTLFNFKSGILFTKYKKSLFSNVLGILVLLLIVKPSPVVSQMKISEIKNEDFISDFDLMVAIVKKQHPNPYKFTKEDVFNRKVDSLRKILVSDPNIHSFFEHSPIELLKDVHSSIQISDEISDEAYKSISYFPYPVLIERGRVFVNTLNKEIPFGSEIKSINDVDIKTILEMVKFNVDGNIASGADKCGEFFSKNYNSSTQKSDQYRICYTLPGKTKAQIVEVKSITPSEDYYRRSKAPFPFNTLERRNNTWWHIDSKKKIGILTVNSFYLSEADAYKQFSIFFKEVNQKKIDRVIIDVRNNWGGDPAISALLYSFITKKTFANTYTYKTKTISLEYPQFIVDVNKRTFSEADIRSEKDFVYQRFDKDTVSGWFIGNARLMEGLLSNYPKDKDAFSGHVTVLIGAGTVSAATYFASLVKINKRGLIIGKETSSGFDATAAAWFVNYQLPRTKTILSVPRTEIYFFNATEDRGRGLMPDKELPVGLFLEYVLKYKDPEMTYAIEMQWND